MHVIRCLPILPVIVALSGISRADIYRWDTGEVIPGTEGIVPGPNVRLDHFDLQYALLNSLWLSGASFTSANLSHAELMGSRLDGVNFRGASITGAKIGFDTAEQLYSTASYQAKDLRGVTLTGYLYGWDLRGQNLTDARFSAWMTDLDLSGAIVTGADMGWMATHYGFAEEQLYSTASYQAKNLSGLGLSGSDLSGWDFHGQNLASANFYTATLVRSNFAGSILEDANMHGVDLTGALLTGANLANLRLDAARLVEASLNGANMTNACLTGATLLGADMRGALLERAELSFTTSRGFTKEQLYSTESYLTKNLHGIQLVDNDISEWNFQGQRLTEAAFYGVNGPMVNFNDADLGSANFEFAKLQRATFHNAQMSGANLDQAVLIDADFSNAVLAGANLHATNLRNSNLRSADLTNADMRQANLTDATFDGAVVAGAQLDGATDKGFVKEQLYSTASYQARQLQGVVLSNCDLTDWDFAGQNLAEAELSNSRLVGSHFGSATLTDASLQHTLLTEADLRNANLSGADLTGADLRNAMLDRIEGAITHNTILPDGKLVGLELNDDEVLFIRDYDGDEERSLPPVPIQIHRSLAISGEAVLRFAFESDPWDSVIGFETELPVYLNGKLEFTFANRADASSLVGKPIQVFDWSGVLPTGVFTVVSNYQWDLSNLYSTGHVTLVRLPGDTNGDGAVNLLDLNNVRNHFGLSGEGILGDTNNDHLVNLIDHNNVRLFFGMHDAQAVPEPSAHILASVTMALVVLRYSRIRSNVG